MDLRCNKTDCKYNSRYACTAKRVEIAKNTDCHTFQKDKNKTKQNLQDVSRDMFEIAPDVERYKHNDKLCVDCKAKCLFNKNGKCNANGITVLESERDGICGTFIAE